MLLQDSILVDYMEPLTIINAAIGFEEFLALNAKTDEVIIFNFKGTITSSFENQKDSPNSTNDIFSMSFMDKDIIVGGIPLKLAIYDREGHQKKEFKMPPLVPRGSYQRQKQIFKTGDNKILGHLHAYPDSAFSNGLIKPMLVMLDPENELAGKPLLEIPASSKYSDGQFHGYVFPTILYSENGLFLAYSNDPTLYIYSYKDRELIFNKAIDLGITDFLEIYPSTSEKTYDFDKNHCNMKPGSISKILSDDRHTYILYFKGIPESIFESKHRSPVDIHFHRGSAVAAVLSQA